MMVLCARGHGQSGTQSIRQEPKRLDPSSSLVAGANGCIVGEQVELQVPGVNQSLSGLVFTGALRCRPVAVKRAPIAMLVRKHSPRHCTQRHRASIVLTTPQPRRAPASKAKWLQASARPLATVRPSHTPLWLRCMQSCCKAASCSHLRPSV